MPTVTLSSKNQITIPAEMVRGLKLKAGDKLVVELIEDHLVLLPEPESWVDYFMGSMKGVYGSTKEEIDKYVAGERASPERWEWEQRFEDLVAQPGARQAVVEVLRSRPNYTASSDEILAQVREMKLDAKDVDDALDDLVKHGGVRRIPRTGGKKGEVHRLVREFAGPQVAARKA